MGVVNKFPKLWEYLYDNPAVVRRLERIKKAVHKFNSPKLKKLFEEFKPDAVACTQAFPCGMVADYKKIYNSNLPLVAVLTDFVPHAFWVYDTVDYYITPSQEVSERLQKKGIPLSRIKILGIPFDPKFNIPYNRDAILNKLGMDPAKPTILIMGGGHGLGPMKTIIQSLEKTKSDLQEIVVTGVNRRLENTLKKTAQNSRHKVLILGFVDYVDELMSVADIILTKPGGITTAEALAKGLAMLIIKPIPGQEENNTVYLIQKGAAIKIDDLKTLNEVVDSLLLGHERLDALRSAARAIAKPQASVDIAKLILSL